jgi:hypothetical protein
MYILTCMCIYIYIYVHIFMYIYMHTYIFVYIYIYIYEVCIYVYIYMDFPQGEAEVIKDKEATEKEAKKLRRVERDKMRGSGDGHRRGSGDGHRSRGSKDTPVIESTVEPHTGRGVDNPCLYFQHVHTYTLQNAHFFLLMHCFPIDHHNLIINRRVTLLPP